MRALFDTQLLKLLSAKGTVNPADTLGAPMYDDFVLSVIALCTSVSVEVPTYFTLHYTRLELEAFQSKLNIEGAGKKCADYKLHRPLPCICGCSPVMGS